MVTLAGNNHVLYARDDMQLIQRGYEKNVDISQLGGQNDCTPFL